MSNKCVDILIVEDQAFFRDLLEIALKDVVPKGSIINKLESGNSAIEFLKEKSDTIGLILLDMKMENGDGITVLNYLEKNGLNSIPVYIVSSLDSQLISFVMQSIGELEVRLVGFIPKDSPDLVTKRIKDIKADILTFLQPTVIDEYVSCGALDSYFDGTDIMSKLGTDLILYIQPKIDLQNGGGIAGYEVLSRLCDEVYGIIDPDNFLCFLDTIDKKTIFNWLVISKVIKIQSKNMIQGFFSPWSINVDPEVFGSPDFVDKLELLMKSNDVDPNLIVLELTETVETNNVSLHLNIARLKLLGVKISLDDFGKGYSNLDRIEQIPFDEVKLDMQLISNVLISDKDRELVVAMIHYLTEKGCKVVAEGVEDAETNQFLVSNGVMEAQGYYYSMPKPISEVDWIFVQLFKTRVSSLLGAMDAESFYEIYSYFHSNTMESINNYLQGNSEVSHDDFIHQIKGTLKTAGLYEAVDFITNYGVTKDKEHVERLRKYLEFFNTVLLEKLVSS